MQPEIGMGFGWVVFAALCGGIFALPLKLRRRFELENIYVIAAAVTMLLLPWLTALWFLPHWQMAIAHAGHAVMMRGLLYGFAWGIGAVTFGYGITGLGLSLGYAIIMGVNTAVGSLIPLLVTSPQEARTPAGKVILAGIALCIVGVAICGWAGVLREKRNGGKPPGQEGGARLGIAWGLTLCGISGILSACANLGFAFTSEIAHAARQLGAARPIATLGSWMPVYWGGFAATLLWFGSQQIRRGTWRKNMGAGAARDWALAGGMGLLWFLAMIPYGVGAYYLGRLGTSVGWAVDIAASLIIANLLGFLTHEWKDSPRVSVNTLYAGLGVLVLAMVVLAKGNAMV